MFSSFTDTMVGEQLLKQEIEKEEETQEEKKEECKKDTPDAIFMLLQRTIDTVLLEEVVSTGVKMNRYREILAKGIMTFADGHEDEDADLSRLVDSFRTGWKAFKQNEDEKATLDVFMKAMNNELWVQEGVDAS